MPRFFIPILLACLCTPAFSQESNQATLAKARGLYDAPFTRDLSSFDCAVEFDWKQHFVAAFGSVPQVVVPATVRLQTISHRVMVNNSRAMVSTVPAQPDLASIAHAADLEQALEGLIGTASEEWIPFASNVVLPVGATKYEFQKIDGGYKLTMNGTGLAETLLLSPELRLSSVVGQQPQILRYTTEFSHGPQGYLLSSIKVEPTNNGEPAGEATFAYRYQAVEGIQLPSTVTLTPETPAKGQPWEYTLTDCHVSKSITVKIGPATVIEPTNPH